MNQHAWQKHVSQFELESIFTRSSSHSLYAALASLVEWLANNRPRRFRDDIFAQIMSDEERQ